MAYTTLAAVRALPDLSNADDFPDSVISAAIERAEGLITDYCGPRIPTTITKYLEPDSGRVVVTGIPWIRSVTLVEFDGVDTTSDVSTFDFFGDIVMTSAFDATQIKVTVSAGEQDDAAPRLAHAALALAAAYTLEHQSIVPDRALAIQSEYGQIQLAQAGGKPDRPTPYPDINAVLNRFRMGPVVS